ncbi:ATP-binding protein [Actinomadura craniellae]|uniref:ATP-binding protein n=1 Tax=Actinomadura craniellae TaxID=2231787 RepID=A0A365H3F3_9ACTN|nr:ATP-binding protein [Actinomadura craniellae]RAY13634.1 ATP-binding protein [Actinomadura craniellae]
MKFSLALPREALSIPVIRRVLGDALSGLGVSDECIGDILVATSEACTNVIRHAHAQSDYEVLVTITDDLCTLKVTDTGRGLRGIPEIEPIPVAGDVTDPTTLRESGRGIRIMQALVDDVTFASRPGHGTSVYLQKRLTWRDEALLRRLEGELVRTAG